LVLPKRSPWPPYFVGAPRIHGELFRCLCRGFQSLQEISGAWGWLPFISNMYLRITLNLGGPSEKPFFLMSYSMLVQATMQFSPRISEDPQDFFKSLGIRPGCEIFRPCLGSFDESEKISRPQEAKTIPAREPRYRPAKYAPLFRGPVRCPPSYNVISIMPQSTPVQALALPLSGSVPAYLQAGRGEATTRPLKTTSSRWIGKKHVAPASTSSFPPPE
jgi:hypothetical protein